MQRGNQPKGPGVRGQSGAEATNVSAVGKVAGRLVAMVDPMVDSWWRPEVGPEVEPQVEGGPLSLFQG